MFKYKFQHYVDVATSASSLTMIKIAAGGEYAMQRMKHLWGAFKYVKMGRVSAKFLPASTLPVDPAGLAYDSSDPQIVDPRDQMNPGLVRITNGEDILDDFTGLSDDQLEQMYINTMLDPRWSKFMLQRGFSRSAVPLYWNVGQLQQDVYPGHVQNLPGIVADSGMVHSTTSRDSFDAAPSGSDTFSGSSNAAFWNKSDSDGRGLFQVGHKGRMGWMPTDAFEWFHDSNGNNFREPLAQPLPCVNVITAILPKAHKTLYYYRLFISETYYFSGIKNTGVGVDGDSFTEYRAVDNFMYVSAPWPAEPSEAKGLTLPVGNVPFGTPDPKNDGNKND